MNQKSSDSYAIYGSEKYAAYLELGEIEWHERYDSLIAKKISLFDRLIPHHTDEAYEMLVRLIDDETTVEVQKKNTEYAWMVIFAQIYLAEKRAGEKVHFYDFANSLKELIEVIQQLKFYMWELEFLNDEDSGTAIFELVSEKTLSSTMFKNLIALASMDKKRITEYFKRRLGTDI